MKERRSRNNILSIISSSGEVLDEDLPIAKECIELYSNLFDEEGAFNSDTSGIDSLQFPSIVNSATAESLTTDVTRDEIVLALSSIGSNKAPGPDGFSSHFFKVCWSIVGDDFVAAIHIFFSKSRILKEINNIFITLVAKCDNPSKVSDFRPIACCNVIYKCITKIISLRMKKVLQDLISVNQSAFVSGRAIQDNIMVAHEVVRNYHRRPGTPRCSLKIDLKKAYDTVNWKAVISTMKKMGFPEKFLNWIFLCISSAKYSIIINGAPYGFFGATRVLRQGCPLSPYLFVIVMEIFNSFLQQQVAQGSYGFHPRCSLTKLTHLCIADDVLVFFKGSVAAATTVKNYLDAFSSCSDLDVNKEKTALYASAVDSTVLTGITTCLDCTSDKLPIRYLGLPLLSTKLSYADCAPLSLECWLGLKLRRQSIWLFLADLGLLKLFLLV